MAPKRGAQQELCDKFGKKYLTDDKKDEHGRFNLPRKRWLALLAKMYDPNLPAEELCFFTQASSGMPQRPVERNMGDRSVLCTVAFKNELPAEKWGDVERPPGFLGPKWPPESVADLLGCSTLRDTCIECAFGDKKIVDDEQYLSWSAKMYDFWLDSILLYKISDEVGYGLKAWKNIPKNTCIGEYTSELVPHDNVSNKKTQYHYEIDIGPIGADGTQTMCWLDATYRGSIFRFMNHSCNPNASVEHGRCSMHNRIMYVYTLRDIKKREAITISYGSKWFSKPSDPCLCGLQECKNPPEKSRDSGKKVAKEAKKKNAKGSKDSNEQEGTGNQRGTAKDADDKDEHVGGQAESNIARKKTNVNDEATKDAAGPETSIQSTPAQTDKESKQSSQASEPTPTKMRGRLRNGRRPSLVTPPPRRKSPRLASNPSESSPTRRRSSRLSPDPSNRVSKQSPRRGPVEPATGGNEARRGPRIRLKTLPVTKGQKKPGAK